MLNPIKHIITLNKQGLALLIFTLLFFSLPSKADISKEQFAYEVKGCVDELYYDTNKYPISKQIPIELIIAQSAHESAWGSSRFAVEGNNLFGVRTWNENDLQIKAKGAPDAPWGLKVYNNWCESIEHYFHILDTLPMYAQFRDELEFQNTIAKQSDPINLTLYLAPWSEQGPKYVRLLQDIMACLYRKNFYKDIV